MIRPPHAKPQFDFLYVSYIRSTRKRTFRKEPVIISVECQSTTVIALVDNGSQASLISQSLAKSLPVIRNAKIRLVDYSGNGIEDHGVVTAEIQINGIPLTFSFYVVKKPLYPFLLGRDFLQSFVVDTLESCKKLTSPVFGERKFISPVNSAPDRIAVNAIISQSVGLTSALVNSKELEATPSSSNGATSGGESQHTDSLPKEVMHASQPIVFGKSKPDAQSQTQWGKSVVMTKNTILTKSIMNVSIPDTLMKFDKIRVGPNVSQATRTELFELISKYRNIFSWEASHIGRTHRLMLDIDTGDSPPVQLQQFNHPEKVHDEIQIHVQKIVDQGFAVKGQGSWSAPAFFVPKKDDLGNYVDKRFCIDYRMLNQRTKKIQIGMPQIDDILNWLRGNTIFSVLDFAAGYYQIPLTESAKEKASFITRDGLFKPTVCPFGVINGPTVFAYLLQLIGFPVNVCKNYFDDLISPATAERQALQKIEFIFQKLQMENLTLKPYKCDFMMDKLTILGHDVSQEGITPSRNHLITIDKLQPPTTGPKARKVMAFFNFFRKYIPNYAELAADITPLTMEKGNIAHLWKEEHTVKFNELKSLLLKKPILSFFYPERGAIVRTDASNRGLGATLSQKDPDGVERYCAYISRSLRKPEANYHSCLLELTAIVWSLKRLRNFVYGVPITVYTDCGALQHLLLGKRRELNARMARYVFALLEYDIHAIKHVRGKHNTCADFLSRYPTEAYDPEQDELEPLPLLLIQDSTFTGLGQEQRQDGRISSIIRRMESGQELVSNMFALREGVLYKRGWTGNQLRLVIPTQWRESIMMECHDHPAYGGHLGVQKTFTKMQQRYWFPRMRREVKKYVRSCELCQSRKTPRRRPYGYMQFINVPKTPFSHLQIDISGPYPTSSNRNSYVISACDYTTKWMETKAISAATSKAVIKFLIEQIVCRHGTPKIIQSDRGTIFTSEFFKEFATAMGLQRLNSTAYHPQTNGVVERSHQVLHDCMSIFMEDPVKSQRDWDKYLPCITFAINTSVHKSTSYTPFFLVYGREAVFPTETVLNDFSNLDILENMQRLRQARLLALGNVMKSQQEYAKYYNSKRLPVPFKVGDKVLVRRFLQRQGLSRKLFHFYYGPYCISEKVSDVNYKILPCSNPVAEPEVIHVDKLKIYFPRVETEPIVVGTEAGSTVEKAGSTVDERVESPEEKEAELVMPTDMTLPDEQAEIPAEETEAEFSSTPASSRAVEPNSVADLEPSTTPLSLEESEDVVVSNQGEVETPPSSPVFEPRYKLRVRKANIRYKY